MEIFFLLVNLIHAPDPSDISYIVDRTSQEYAKVIEEIAYLAGVSMGMPRREPY